MLFFCLKCDGSNIMFCFSESSQLIQYIGTAAVEMFIIISVVKAVLVASFVGCPPRSWLEPLYNYIHFRF